MPRAVGSGGQVVVCSTCRYSANARENAEGRRGGALLAEALRQARDADAALTEIGIKEMACLFACSRHCTVHIRAPGKLSYVLGDFAPDAAAARAILDYAAEHAASARGSVPYGEWPEGVKGHFIVRVPPEGDIP